MSESTIAQPQACRNCGNALGAGDEYCARCGQETRVALPTARQFMREAAGRYVAFDGRLWRTLAALMIHPGFLTREYFAGRRRRYIRPGRLFLVTSLVAFAAIRLSIGAAEELMVRVPDGVHIDVGNERPKNGARGAPKDAVKDAAKDAAKDATIIDTDDLNVAFDRDLNVTVGRDANNLVPTVLRDRIDRFNQLPRNAKIEQIVGNTLRYGPYAAFVLLPAFALLLAIAYPLPSRRHPQRPRRFAGHLVFAAHNHAFLFALTTLLVLVPMPSLLAVAALAAACVYLVVSLRIVYGGGWTLTLLRSFMLLVAYVVLFALVTFGLLMAALLLR